MKKIVVLLALIGSAYYAYHKVISRELVWDGSVQRVTIKELKSNPGNYVNREAELENVNVVHSETFLNHSLSMIQDGTDSVILLSDKPYRVGEDINVRGRYEVVYSNGSESFDMFIADSSSH